MNVYMYVNKDLKAPRNDSEHIVNMQLFAKKKNRENHPSKIVLGKMCIIITPGERKNEVEEL